MNIQGNAVKVIDNKGLFIDDIDTDQIFHNRFLTIRDRSKMGKHAFSNLEGWEDYPEKAARGDILICGANFGAGSSRQQAVGCFQALGVRAIVAKSFAPIYYRNAINAGMAILIAPDLNPDIISDGHSLDLDLENGLIRNITTGKTIIGIPASKVQLDILDAGSLLDLA